jgi:predicted permease
MNLAARMRSFFTALLLRSRMEREMGEEFRFHLEQRTDDLVAQGMARDAAGRMAMREFGNPLPLREESREARGLRWLDEIRQDLRIAFRLLKKSPAFTAAAVVSLALGIGANTAIFSLVDAVLFRLLPVEKPQELMFLAHGNADRPIYSSNYPLLARYRELTTGVFSGIAAYNTRGFRVMIGDELTTVSGQYASGNYHHVVGAPIALGRGFAADSDRDHGGAPGVVISDGYWTRRYGRDPSAIGQTIAVEGSTLTIVGVTAPGFTGLMSGTAVDITLPISLRVEKEPRFLTANDTWTGMVLIGRLKPGVTEAQAEGVAHRVLVQFMSEPENTWARDDRPSDFEAARLVPALRGSTTLRRQYTRPLWIMMALVGLVLLIACVNVANLLLARSASRAREVAIRLCVGGGRWRLIRQFLTESLLLALFGGALGIAGALWGTPAILALLQSEERPIFLDAAVNLRILAFTAGVSILSGVGFGLLPALKSTRVDLSPALKGLAATGGGRRWPVGKTLVAFQMSLCVVIVTAAALLQQSLYNLRALDGGFDRQNLLTFRVDAAPAKLETPSLKAFYARLVGRFSSMPGVEAAAVSGTNPVSTSYNMRALHMPALPQVPESIGVFTNVVTRDYFRTLGIRLSHGRLFTDADSASPRRIAIVNEGMARFYFGRTDIVGQTVSFRPREGTPPKPIEVVGVVEDVVQVSLKDPAPRTLYTLVDQEPEPTPWSVVTIRAGGDTTALAATVRTAVRELNRSVVVDYVRTMEAQIDDSLVTERVLATLSTTFGTLALLLAIVGLYGVVAFDMTRRRKEIGVRIAIGATRAQVVRRVIGDTLRVAGLGVAAGVAAAVSVVQVVETLLWDLEPRDPLTLSVVAVVLTLVAMLAAWLPARNASRLDPMHVLRTE